jgi:phosphatidylglycerophosphate synthase
LFDRHLRPIKDRLLEPAAERLARHLGANTLTGVALASTLGAASLAVGNLHLLALGAWLLGRLLDGLDGAVARRRNEASDYGGYLDMVADTVGYAAVPIGVAFGIDQRSAWIALALLLASFYVNAISWTWLSAVLEKRGAGAATTGETTSITMPPALVEGTETIIFFGLFLTLPDLSVWLFTTMAALVTVNVIQRLAWARRELDVMSASASSSDAVER